MLILILGKLSYQEQGRLLVVKKRWRRLIEENLPSVKSFIISGYAKNNPEEIKGLDKYALYSEF